VPNDNWQISGEYFESCSCDYLCPCIVTGLTAMPTQGSCTVPLAFHINQGHFGGTRLDGLNFVVVVRTPEAMIKGNWQVGLIVDQRASPEQQQAIAGIATGQAGGPMAALGPLIGGMLGMEVRPIQFEVNGPRRSISVPELLDMAVEGVPGANSAEPVMLDNAPHPVTPRVALAKASRSHLHAFGLNWDDSRGQNNGHFAPFNWRSG
jgi:hypothetical protein